MSLGALTTTFTLPTACAQSFENIYITSDFLIAQGPLYSADGASCFPKGYKPDRSSYFSPGFCASGYTPAYSSSGIIAGNVEETTVICCPSVSGKRFFYDTGRAPFSYEIPFACKSNFRSMATVMSSISDGTTATITPTYKDGGAVNAHGYQIRFQASDTLTPSSVLIPPNPSQSVPPPESNTPVPSGPPSSSSGLSSGAAAGIGVSATIVVIALVLAAFFFGRRSSQRKKQGRLDAERDDANPPDNGNSMRILNPSAGAARHNGQQDPQKYYYSAAPFEMGASPTVGELPTEQAGLMGGAQGQGRRRDGGPSPVELDAPR